MLPDELTGAVPKDDAPIPDDDKKETVDVDEVEVDEKAEVVDEADKDLDPDAVAAVAGEDEEKDGFIPKGRFNEVNERKKELALEVERQARIIENLSVREREPVKEVKVIPPRDFEAEFAALEKRLNDGEIDESEHRKLDRALMRAEAKAEALAEVTPVAQALEKERERAAAERVTNDLQRAASKIYEKYPFLDFNAEGKNDEAIAAVLAERDDLIKTGVSPVKALRLAVASIAPDYVPEAAAARGGADTDEMAARRKAAAQKAAGIAESKTPPPVAGAGNGARTPTVQKLSGSVKEHEKWEKTPEKERDKAFTA